MRCLTLPFLSLLLTSVSSVCADDHLQQVQNRLSHSSRILIRPATANNSAEDRLLALSNRSRSVGDTLIEALEVSSRELRRALNRSDSGAKVGFAEVQPSLERMASAVEQYLLASGVGMWRRMASSFGGGTVASDMWAYFSDSSGRFDGSIQIPSLLALESDARNLLFGRNFDSYSVKRLVGSIDRSIVVLGRKATGR